MIVFGFCFAFFWRCLIRVINNISRWRFRLRGIVKEYEEILIPPRRKFNQQRNN